MESDNNALVQLPYNKQKLYINAFIFEFPSILSKIFLGVNFGFFGSKSQHCQAKNNKNIKSLSLH